MFFFVLASLARCSISIGLLDRPLIAAFLFGAITSTLEFALPLGIILELFWLDVLRLGAVIPPSGTLSFLLLYPLTLLFSWQAPSQLAVPLLICLPFAYTITWVELWQRKRTNVYINDLEAWVENPQNGISPQDIVYKTMARFILWECLLYITLFTSLWGIFTLLNKAHALPLIAHMNWPILYSMGLMGAVLALRTKRAYAILAIGIIIAFLL